MAKTRVGVRRPGIWDGLLAYYRADGTPVDQTGNGHDLTLINGTTYDTGKINQGFKFDGINDYAEYTGDVGITGDFTISGWIYRNNTGTSCFVQSKNFGISNGVIGVSFVSRLSYLYMIDNSGTLYSQSTAGVFDPNIWYHFVVTFNDTTKKSKMYYNGNLDSKSDTTTFNNCNGLDFVNGFVFSRRTANQFLNGSMDEIGIWNRELTPTEVSQLYNSGNGKQK